MVLSVCPAWGARAHPRAHAGEAGADDAAGDAEAEEAREMVPPQHSPIELFSLSRCVASDAGLPPPRVSARIAARRAASAAAPGGASGSGGQASSEAEPAAKRARGQARVHVAAAFTAAAADDSARPGPITGYKQVCDAEAIIGEEVVSGKMHYLVQWKVGGRGAGMASHG